MKKLKYITEAAIYLLALTCRNAEVRLSKAELARQILNIINNRLLTQTQVTELLGIDQSKVSALTPE